jgi:hypothetical protein
MVELKQTSTGFSYGSLECGIFVFSSVIFISAVLFCDISGGAVYVGLPDLFVALV